MLKRGIIEPSLSSWSSPVVMVPKKSGKMRFCIDYRKLNNVTKKDNHPLPRIDELLDKFQGSKWFTSIDLKAGFWNVPIKEEDREKTAFITSEVEVCSETGQTGHPVNHPKFDRIRIHPFVSPV